MLHFKTHRFSKPAVRPKPRKESKYASTNHNQSIGGTAFSYAKDIIRDQKIAEKEKVAKLKLCDDREFDFVHLRRHPDPPCRFENIYWLEIAPETITAHNDYYTLSSSGLTHFHDGNVEYLDIMAWLNEKAVFDHMVNMPCVGRIRMAIMFHRWKDRVYGDRVTKAK